MESTVNEEKSNGIQSKDGSWGWLSDVEGYGRGGDKPEDFKPITYEEAVNKYREYRHAGHAMFFSKTDRLVWDLYKVRANIMMQMRFDGKLGFPGGLVETGEDPIIGVNRELVEEIGIDLQRHGVDLKDWLNSHIHEEKNLVLHFFVKEIPEKDFKQIEQNALQAEEYGIEMLGTVRPPLFTMGDNVRGFPAFLTNHFCGNAKEQLLTAIATHNILTKEEIEKAVETSQSHIDVQKRN